MNETNKQVLSEKRSKRLAVWSLQFEEYLLTNKNSPSQRAPIFFSFLSYPKVFWGKKKWFSLSPFWLWAALWRRWTLIGTARTPLVHAITRASASTAEVLHCHLIMTAMWQIAGLVGPDPDATGHPAPTQTTVDSGTHAMSFPLPVLHRAEQEPLFDVLTARRIAVCTLYFFFFFKHLIIESHKLIWLWSNIKVKEVSSRPFIGAWTTAISLALLYETSLGRKFIIIKNQFFFFFPFFSPLWLEFFFFSYPPSPSPPKKKKKDSNLISRPFCTNARNCNNDGGEFRLSNGAFVNAKKSRRDNEPYFTPEEVSRGVIDDDDDDDVKSPPFRTFMGHDGVERLWLSNDRNGTIVGHDVWSKEFGTVKISHEIFK